MPAECTYLPATVDVEVSDVGCVVLVSAYDVHVVVPVQKERTWEELVKKSRFYSGSKK